MEATANHKGIVTYLLGAGASANSLPIVKNYLKRFKIFINFLDSIKIREIDQKEKNEIDEICKDFTWLIKNINSISVDSFAYELYKKDIIDDLNKLKKLLVFFFNIEQLRNPVDRRYVPFIEKIWPGDRSNLPSNRIRILDWNYDFQLEMTLTDLAKYSINFDQTNLQRQCLPSPLYMHEDSVQRDYYKNFATDQFSICHLNGVCYCYKFDLKKAQINQATPVALPFTSIFDPFEKNRLPFEEIVKNQLSNYFDLFNRKGNFTAIEFAWEKPESNRSPDNIREKVIEKAIEATKDTEILMVLGYSFPKDNSEFDSKIVTSMKSLKMVFIQDPYAGKIKTNLLKTCNNYIKEAKVSIWMNDDINDFIVSFI